jgi:hypothetical protein
VLKTLIGMRQTIPFSFTCPLSLIKQKPNHQKFTL